MGRKLKIGDRATNFSLEDQEGRLFTLSDFKGKRVLLSFHPLAWTSVCSEQMKSLEKNKEAFDSLNTMAVGVSIDTVPLKEGMGQGLGH